MRRGQPEHQLQRLFIQYVDQLCGQYPELALAYAIPNARGSDGFAAKMRYLEGARSGPLDWCYPLPHGQYTSLRIEFKTEDGSLTSTQTPWFYALGYACCYVDVCRTLQQAVDRLSAYLALPPKYEVEPVRIYARELLAARAERKAKRDAKTNRNKRIPKVTSHDLFGG